MEGITRPIWLVVLDSVLEKEADLVVLLVGTNDMLNSGNAVSLPEYRANLARLVKRVEASGSRAVLITVPPCHEPYLLSRHAPAFYRPEGPNEKVKKVNGFLREFAVEKHLPLVDLYQLLTAIGQIGIEPESLLRNEANSGKPDGVHPTADGYRLMALAVYETIRHHRLPHGRVVCLGDSITFGAGMPGAGTADGSTYPAFLKRAVGHLLP